MNARIAIAVSCAALGCADGTVTGESGRSGGAPSPGEAMVSAISENGLNTKYYKDGKPASRGTLVGGKRHGVWRSWYPNGALFSQTAYLKGAPFGRWSFYYPDGQRQARMDFAEGRLIGDLVVWSPLGEVLTFASFDSDPVQGLSSM